MSSVKSSSALSQVTGQASTDDIVLKELTETKRKPLVEIVPPGNVILGSATLTSSKANAMKQAQPQTGPPLLLEGPPAIGPQLEGSQLQTIDGGAVVTSSIGTAPTPKVNQHDPVLAALSQPPTNTNMQQVPLPPVALSGNVPSPLDLPPVPTAIPSSAVSQPSVDLHQLTASSMFPTVVPSSANLSTISSAPPVMQQVLTGVSQPPSNLQPLSTDFFPIAASPVGIPNTVSQTSGFDNAPEAVMAESKVSELAVPSKVAGPSVAALVDFFS